MHSFSKFAVGAIALIALISALHCSQGSAAPAEVQATTCPTSPCTVASGPTNGNTEVFQLATTASLAGDTVSDSVGLFTAEHSTCVAGNVSCVETFDKKVSGSPSTSITISATSQAGGAFLEISGLAVSGTNNFTGAQSASSTSLVATIAGVTNTDMQVCSSYETAITSGATGSPALSNGTSVAIISDPGHNVASIRSRYSLATSTASSTCTQAQTAGTNISMEYADYIANAPIAAITGAPKWVGAYDPAMLLLLGSYIPTLRPDMVCIIRWDGGDECWRDA